MNKKISTVVRAINLVRGNHRLDLVLGTFGAKTYLIDYAGGHESYISLLASGTQWKSRIKIPALGGTKKWRAYANINTLTWIENDFGVVEFIATKSGIEIRANGVTAKLERSYTEEDVGIESLNVSHKIQLEAFRSLITSLDYNKSVQY